MLLRIRSCNFRDLSSKVLIPVTAVREFSTKDVKVEKEKGSTATVKNTGIKKKAPVASKKAAENNDRKQEIEYIKNFLEQSELAKR